MLSRSGHNSWLTVMYHGVCKAWNGQRWSAITCICLNLLGDLSSKYPPEVTLLSFEAFISLGFPGPPGIRKNETMKSFKRVFPIKQQQETYQSVNQMPFIGMITGITWNSTWQDPALPNELDWSLPTSSCGLEIQITTDFQTTDISSSKNEVPPLINQEFPNLELGAQAGGQGVPEK